MSLRRRSSQYSLFPTCPPLPSQTGTQPFASNGSPSHMTFDNQFPSRNHSSDPDSGGKAADILARTEPKGKEGRRHTTVGKRSSTDLTILRVIQKLKRQSTNMSQLIPLKLQSSVVATRMPSPMMKTLPSTRTFSSLSTSPVYPPERPAIPSRSSSIRRERPGPVTDLTIFPYTQKEWRKVMEEVQELYSKGKYKHCSMRCQQILKGIKDPYRVHPLYSIYLSFFAASSLEITASSLPNHASAKLPLYQEALAFYQKAESYIEYAAFSADSTTTIHPSSSRHCFAHPQRPHPSHQMMHHASNSSISSINSVRSSVDSIFSARSSSACSVASSFASPTSPFESQELSLHRSSSLSSRSSTESFRPCHSGGQQRPKKKVSFSLSTAQLPVLPSENENSTPSIDASILIDSFPSPPTSQAPSPTSTAPPSTPEPRTNPAIARYCHHLSDLATQLSFHITSINTSIASHSSARAARHSNGLGLTLSLLDDAMGSQLRASPEGKKPDIQERTRRLREQGWNRKRFDGERYRLLCEKALDEIAEKEMF